MAFNYEWVENTIQKSATPAEGCKNVLATIREGIKKPDSDPQHIDITRVNLGKLALAMGAVDKYDAGSPEAIREAFRSDRHWDSTPEGKLLAESAGPSVTTSALKIVTSELLSREIIQGYENTPDISDRLCTRMQISGVREQKMAGFTSIGDPALVEEGQPYPHTAFNDKYVLTKEDKYGLMLSLSMEAIMFDQTGEVQRRARMTGERLKDYRQRLIINGVCGATITYRPRGVDTALYSSTNLNLIGTSGVTGYTTAVALQDWTDIDTVLQMREEMIVDDRVDASSAQPIGGINDGEQILLVPGALRAKGWYIKNQAQGRVLTDSGNLVNEYPGSPIGGVISDVLSHPYVKTAAGAATTWYLGNFKRQFVWAEVYPVRTWIQGAESESAFETDTVFRIKSGFFGGIVATDTFFVTKVLGA